jgi:hypothetical protein
VLGQLIFADIPLATVGGEDALWGWNNQCPDKNIWNKVPANEDQWSTQVRASNIWNKRLAASSDWQKQETTQSSWSKLKPRVEDHKKC